MHGLPDERDPVAYLPWLCETAVEIGLIVVTVLDDKTRSLILRNIASQLGAPYIICQPFKSSRRFLEFLAKELRIGVRRNWHDLWDDLKVRLHEAPRLVVLDRAELLTRTSLEILLDFHKMEEHRKHEAAFVLASSQQRLLKLVDFVDREGSFIRHCEYYIPGCEPTKRMRERAKLLDEATAPRAIPFSAIASRNAGAPPGSDKGS